MWRVAGHRLLLGIRPFGSRNLHRYQRACPLLVSVALGRAPTRGLRWYSDKTVKGPQSVKERAAIGPFTWQSLVVFLITGVGLVAYFKNERDRVEKFKQERIKKPIGKPNIGGPFSLIDQHGKVTTDKDFAGRFMLVYFGFTNCPDICPEELDKMAVVIDRLYKDPEVGRVITPIFISCDPQRDTVEAVRQYLKDFHSDIVGLTGTFEQISKVAKAYRVYVSKPPEVKEGEDYLVDHSIFFYLIDPKGEFLAVYGRIKTADEIVEDIRRQVKTFEEREGPLNRIEIEPSKTLVASNPHEGPIHNRMTS